VFFVADDRDSHTIYLEYLRSMGCRVIAARDGAAAIDQAVQHRPDIIIIDLAMSHVDGLAELRQLRRQEPTQRVAIIALTAMPAARDSAREAGCDAFLAKPCLPELLWWEVRSLLTRMPSGRPLWPRETAGDPDGRSRPAIRRP
jgi:CheY-like chemotaxis protein